jgi:hypothetical protein
MAYNHWLKLSILCDAIMARQESLEISSPASNFCADMLLHLNPEGLDSLQEVLEMRVHWKYRDHPHVIYWGTPNGFCKTLALAVHIKSCESNLILV